MLVSVSAVILLGLYSSHVAEAAKGIDVSTSVSRDEFVCLKENGYNLVVVRAYRSFGIPDRKADQTLRNAWSAGFRYIDVYLFPCPKCRKSAADQVHEMG